MQPKANRIKSGDDVSSDSNQDPMYREDQAAELLTVRVKTLQAWRSSGTGPRYIKLGSGLRSPVRYRRSELMRFLADGERRSTSEHSAGAGE